MGQNFHRSSLQWKPREKCGNCVHKCNAFPKTMQWAISAYEKWASFTSVNPEMQRSSSFQRTKYSSKCAVSPRVLQKRNENVKGTDQDDGNKVVGG